MTLLQHIKRQPPMIRGIMFAFSVVTALSVVGTIWVQSFQTNLYALLNPEQEAQKQDLAQGPLVVVGDMLSNLRAAVSSFLSGSGQEGFDSNSRTGHNERRVYLFPIARDR